MPCNAAEQVVLKLQTSWRDGPTSVLSSALEFIQRLGALVQRAATALANECFAAASLGSRMPCRKPVIHAAVDRSHWPGRQGVADCPVRCGHPPGEFEGQLEGDRAGGGEGVSPT